MLRLGCTFWRPRYFHLAYILIAFAPASLGQKEGAGNEAALAANMQKFQEVYGMALKLMNLGGNILNNAQSGPSSAPSPTQFSRDGGGGGNGIFNEVRPQLRSVPNYEYDKYGTSFGGSALGNSEYGGGLLGSGSKSQPRSIMDSLLGSFLGSSLGGSSGSSSAASSIFQPNFDEYGSKRSRYGNSGQGSNIEAIVDALSKNGVKRAVPEEDSGLNPANFLSQFFQGR